MCVCVSVCIGVCMYTAYILYNLSDIVTVAAALLLFCLTFQVWCLRLAVYFRHTTVRISNFRNVALCLQYAQEKKLQQKGLASPCFHFHCADCGCGCGSAAGCGSGSVCVSGCGSGSVSGLIYKLLPGCAL